ncbi:MULTISPECIES: hypothetical protein [unclassified Mesorhizobium]|uniref:hypothetical protein n=1 Tax=unclassified Mesorhizobium TaxID=325217 RepID=UPI0011264E9B|nr:MULTISPECIES: hypothetical protein [unclassified Mesorhizobium]TPL05609.1 hypothetical protein FJ567_00580 [Mesorhizobium sp. B2-4-16]TPL75377.1 hypothetical protein FJ956_06065 [Mesorhizobium sp. B2-4-3]
MVSVNASAATALATLNLIKSRINVSQATQLAGTPSIDPKTSVRLSPAVSDAILKIGQLVRGSQLSDLPAEHAERLRSLGADSATRVQKPVVSDAEFQKTVMSYVKDAWTGLDGFNEALASGNVKIQRASDVKDLGYETIQYDLYKDGSLIGGAGWDTINRSFYDAQAAAGVRQGVGSIDGLDYYVTW